MGKTMFMFRGKAPEDCSKEELLKGLENMAEQRGCYDSYRESKRNELLEMENKILKETIKDLMMSFARGQG